MMPPPMPVPSVIISTSSTPRAAPATHSPHAAQLASFSTTIVLPGKRSRSPARTGTSAAGPRLGAKRSTPVRSMRPGAPTPTRVAAGAPACSSRATPAMASITSCGSLGVGTRCSAVTSPSAVSTTPRHLVPPTSTPMVSSGVTTAGRSAHSDALDTGRVRRRTVGAFGPGPLRVATVHAGIGAQLDQRRQHRLGRRRGCADQGLGVAHRLLGQVEHHPHGCDHLQGGLLQVLDRLPGPDLSGLLLGHADPFAFFLAATPKAKGAA